MNIFHHVCGTSSIAADLAILSLLGLLLPIPAALAYSTNDDCYQPSADFSQPHNIASQYLHIAPALQLTGHQVGVLVRLRNKYIKNNSIAERELRANRMDLYRLLHADKLNERAIDRKLKEIRRNMSQLWNAYESQLNAISSLLTKAQTHLFKATYFNRAYATNRVRGHGKTTLEIKAEMDGTSRCYQVGRC